MPLTPQIATDKTIFERLSELKEGTVIAFKDFDHKMWFTAKIADFTEADEGGPADVGLQIMKYDSITGLDNKSCVTDCCVMEFIILEEWH